MRTRLWQFYDKLYYGFERWAIVQYDNRAARKKLRGKKFDKAFYSAYKNTIRPYWAQFGVKPKKLWVKYYFSLSGSLDPRYIPNDILALKILPHFNNMLFVRPLADKNLNNLVFPQAKRPETAVKHMSGEFRRDDFTVITREEAISRCLGDRMYFIKPSQNSSEGRDIRAFSGAIGHDAVAAILDEYQDIDYIVQHGVIQHPQLAAMNPSSVNTIRLITLLFRGKVEILSAILRIGTSGSSVDNIGAGGYQCNILPDGTLDKTAYTHETGKETIVERTRDGVAFAGIPVPFYDRVCTAAVDMAEKAPHLKYIAWDFAVDESGDPVLIEFNAHIPGQNQETSGPTFRNLTDDVLNEVFGKK